MCFENRTRVQQTGGGVVVLAAVVEMKILHQIYPVSPSADRPRSQCLSSSSMSRLLTTLFLLARLV